MLTGKPGLFGIDGIYDTIQSCHIQNLVYKHCNERLLNA
jgi:hypothetical protein